MQSLVKRRLADNRRARRVDRNAQRCDVIRAHVILAAALVVVANYVFTHIVVHLVGSKFCVTRL